MATYVIRTRASEGQKFSPLSADSMNGHRGHDVEMQNDDGVTIRGALVDCALDEDDTVLVFTIETPDPFMGVL